MVKNLREKTETELNKMLKVEEIGVLINRTQRIEGKLKDVTLARKARKQVARINTILREKEFLNRG